MAKATQPTVTLKNIAADIAEKHELTKKQVNAIMDDLVTALVKNLKKGNRVRLAGLGILQVRKRAARMGRNPATGETIKIPAKKKIAFRAAKELATGRVFLYLCTQHRAACGLIYLRS